jgi:hypothetical protein
MTSSAPRAPGLVLSRRPGFLRPHQEHQQRNPLHGIVQGGQHVGGGRSVAPHRDAPVPEGGGNPPTPEEEEAAYGARQSVDDWGNPLDL